MPDELRSIPPDILLVELSDNDAPSAIKRLGTEALIVEIDGDKPCVVTRYGTDQVALRRADGNLIEIGTPEQFRQLAAAYVSIAMALTRQQQPHARDLAGSVDGMHAKRDSSAEQQGLER